VKITNFSFDLIKKNNFDYTWETLYVGRKLKLITSVDVMKYAIEFLDKNKENDDLDIIELAWNLPEYTVDELLFKIVGLKKFNENGHSSSLDVEYRKWRYCALKEICNNAINEEQIFKGVEDIFSLYKCPDDMREMFTKCSNKYYYNKDNDYLMYDLVNNFLKEERMNLK
jgi:hypothetical protein